MTSARPIRILLADDDENDVLLTEQAFRDQKVHIDMYVVKDGRECMAYLHQEAPYNERARPDLVLLDINMPKMTGLEVLEAIRGDERLRSIPVVILTTSSSDQDVLAAYDKLCSCYIVKPVRFDDFKQIVKQIETFWLSVVTLPP